MNVINTIRRREQEFGSIYDYNIPLYCLKCYWEDTYDGIAPNICTNDFKPSMLACRFCIKPGYQELLALADENGNIAFQSTKLKNWSFNQQPIGTQAHNDAIFDIAWMPGELKLVTVSGDEIVRLWDVATSRIKLSGCFHGHNGYVKTATFRHQDKEIFATGGRDGSIMIWDIRANHLNQPDTCIYNAHISRSDYMKRKMFPQVFRAQSITGLVFQNDITLISCAAGDGLIKVWDLRKTYTIHEQKPKAKYLMKYAGNIAGFSSLLLCPAKITLYANCMDNIIYAYNVSSYNRAPIAKYYGHKNRTYNIKMCTSSDGRYLASGSSDDHAYIWNTNRPGLPLVKLSGHTEEVTCIAWCNVGETKIVTCSDKSWYKIWRVRLEYEAKTGICGQAKTISEKNRKIFRKFKTTFQG